MQEHFDTVAARYDLINTLLSFGLQHLWTSKAVTMLGLKAGDRVLDACGGTPYLPVVPEGIPFWRHWYRREVVLTYRFLL